MKKGILDRILEKLISRKLLVFVVATHLLLLADLSSDIWGMIAIVYIGSQGVVDFAKEWKHNGPKEIDL